MSDKHSNLLAKRRLGLAVLLTVFVFLSFSAHGVVAGNPGYVIEAEDVLRIDVDGARGLNRIVSVQSSGLVNYSPLGRIQVAGRTISDLAAYIEKELSGVVEGWFEVSIRVEEYGHPRFMVLGEVNRPGEYSLETSIDLSGAIGIAGGPNEGAALHEVAISRGSEVQYVDTSDEGSALAHNIEVLPGDIIYVPRDLNMVRITGQDMAPGFIRVDDETDTSLRAIIDRLQEMLRNRNVDHIEIIRDGHVKAAFAYPQAGEVRMEEFDTITLRAGDMIVLSGTEEEGLSVYLNRLRGVYSYLRGMF